jgi:hypothetical protein
MNYNLNHPTYPGQAKGMEAIIKERGLWSFLEVAAGGKKVVGRCKVCKLSEEKREKAEKEARAWMAEDSDAFASLREPRQSIILDLTNSLLSKRSWV